MAGAQGWASQRAVSEVWRLPDTEGLRVVAELWPKGQSLVRLQVLGGGVSHGYQWEEGRLLPVARGLLPGQAMSFPPQGVQDIS